MNSALPIPEPVIAEAVGYRPTKIDGYEIRDIVGRGGMGIVYRARHLALGRDTAIKLIRNADLADPKDLSRFHYEAEMAAALQHPNIVQLFQYGEQDGRPYLAFEFVEGGSLAAKISGKPQPPIPSAKLVETLARAVHCAHLRGIVHQDLKPANILLTPDGTPKIADFGLARRLENVTRGQSEVIVGTAGYMSPEQAWGDGQAQRIGPPTDIYALGAILYELLTGRPPFQAESSRETLEQVWTREPTSPRQIVKTIPKDLEIICLRCLQKDQTRRYPSAEALADDLSRFVQRLPIKARSVGDWERAWLWSRRNPAIAALIAAVFFIGAIGFGGTLKFAVDAEAAAAVAKKNEKTAKDETEKANAANKATQRANEEVKKQQYPLFMVYADREIIQGRLVDARKYLDRCREQDRGMEWHFCRRITNGTDRQILLGKGKVNSLRAGTDGKSFLANLFSADAANSLRLLDSESLKLLATLPTAGRKSSVSPDGKYVALGLWEELQLYRTADAKVLHKIPGMVCSDFAPQGQVMAVGSGKEVNIYRLENDAAEGNLQSIHRLEELSFPAAAVTFAGSEHKLFVLAAEPFDHSPLGLFGATDVFGTLAKEKVAKKYKWQIFVWDRSLRESRSLATGESTMSWDYLAASQDGSLLIAGNSGATGLYEWKALRVGKNAAGVAEAVPQEGEPFAELYKTPCQAFALSTDGKRLAHANYHGTINVVDTAASGGTSQILRSDQPQVESLAFLSGDQLLSGGTDGSVKVWNLTKSVSGVRHLPGEHTFAAHTTKPILATTAQHGEIRIWDLRTLQRVKTLPALTIGKEAKPIEIDDLKFSADGEQLLAAYRDHNLRTWDLAGEKIAKTFAAPPFDASKSAATMPANSWSQGIRARAFTGGSSLQHELNQGVRYSISPDGRSLARKTSWNWEPTAKRDLFLFLPRAVTPTYYHIDSWDLASGTHKFAIAGEAPLGTFADLQFGRQGKELELSITQTYSRETGHMRKFDASSGRETMPLTKVDLSVTRVLSPDGSRAIELRTNENELLLVDTQTNFVLIKPLPKNHYFLTAFTPDGQRVVVWNSDGIDILDGSPIEASAAP
ncbi:MAG: protein kinase domain-containing protein [Pirellulaceae bacterium]